MTEPVLLHTLDRCAAAHFAEWERWCVRRRGDKRGYELVRNSSPNNDINADSMMEITHCDGAASYTDAEEWLDQYRGRASMVASMDVMFAALRAH